MDNQNTEIDQIFLDKNLRDSCGNLYQFEYYFFQIYQRYKFDKTLDQSLLLTILLDRHRKHVLL